MGTLEGDCWHSWWEEALVCHRAGGRKGAAYLRRPTPPRPLPPAWGHLPLPSEA